MIHISQCPRDQSSEYGETPQQAYGASRSNQMYHPWSLNSFFLDKSREYTTTNVYELTSAKKSIWYLHACVGFPTKKYWLKAIKGGNYTRWPNLTAEAVKQHFPEFIETKQGHIRGIKQNNRSTREKNQPLTYQLENGETLIIPLQKKQDVYEAINDAKETMYTDQTGAFTVTYKRGNKFIIIMCEIDNDIIMSEAIRNISSGETVRACQDLMQRLKAAGIRPKNHVLGNEC